MAEGVTWPGLPANAGWIKFWRDLDVELGDALGAVKLGDAFWGSFTSGPFGGNVVMAISHEDRAVNLLTNDQRENVRPIGGKGDIGAVEQSVD